MISFDPKEPEFPDAILCPICKNMGYCEESGDTCNTINAMQEDMERDSVQAGGAPR